MLPGIESFDNCVEAYVVSANFVLTERLVRVKFTYRNRRPGRTSLMHCKPNLYSLKGKRLQRLVPLSPSAHIFKYTKRCVHFIK